MNPSPDVESYRFWDVVTQWAREQRLDEQLVARALARGVIQDGLRLQSVDSRWSDPARSERPEDPPVGYAAIDGEPAIFIRPGVLAHLMAVVERAAVPDRQLLNEEFLSKQDVLHWLQCKQIEAPQFWFAPQAAAAAGTFAPSGPDTGWIEF